LQGHTVGAAITGGMHGGNEQAPAEQDYTQQQQPYYSGQSQQQAGGTAPCQLELKQFIECAQTQYDITLCQGFNEALRQCRISNGEWVSADCQFVFSLTRHSEK